MVRHDVRRNINIDDIPHWSMIPLCNWENKYYLSTHIHWVISATHSFIYIGHVVPSIVQKTQIMDAVYDQFWSKCEYNIIWNVERYPGKLIVLKNFAYCFLIPEALQSREQKIILSSSDTEFLLCNKSVFVASSCKPWRKAIDRASLTYSKKNFTSKVKKKTW